MIAWSSLELNFSKFHSMRVTWLVTFMQTHTVQLHTKSAKNKNRFNPENLGLTITVTAPIWHPHNETQIAMAGKVYMTAAR